MHIKIPAHYTYGREFLVSLNGKFLIEMTLLYVQSLLLQIVRSHIHTAGSVCLRVLAEVVIVAR